MNFRHGAVGALLALSLCTLPGCGPIIREMLGQTDPQTAVTVSCAESGGDASEETTESAE